MGRRQLKLILSIKEFNVASGFLALECHITKLDFLRNAASFCRENMIIKKEDCIVDFLLPARLVICLIADQSVNQLFFCVQ